MELRTLIWEAITQDEQLNSLFGGTVRLYNTWSQPDSPYPYAVYRISELPQDPWIVTQAEVNIDIFSRTDTQARALEIERRIREMFGHQHFDGYRFFHTITMEVPEDTRYVWHINQVWTVRYTQDWRLENAAGI